MYIVESVDDLWNYIAYVNAYAPDRFPYEDFLPDDKQMNLDRAFEQLRKGIEIAYPEKEFIEKREMLNGILNRSYVSYRAGEEDEAGNLLNDFESNIFNNA